MAESYWRYDFKTKKFIANPVLKFHAAEHMAYNFYNTYKRVPTLEEIKKSSRFSEHCGRYRMLSELGFSTVFTLFLMTVTTNFGFIVSLSLLGLMLFLYVILFNSGKLKFLEVLVTRKPTDLELQCAIKGLETLDKLEKSIKEENADISEENCFKCLKIEISDPKLYEEYFNSAIDNLFDFCDEVN